MRVTIVSDASYCSRTHAAGYGFWAVSQRGRHAGGGSFRAAVPDQNVAEIMAIVNALHVTLGLGIAAKGDQVLIQTDSHTAIIAFTGKWRTLKHRPDAIRAVDVFHGLRGTHELAIEFRHVKGHTRNVDSRSKAQRHADSRAKSGMYKARARVSK